MLISRTNLWTSGTPKISKPWSTSNAFQSHFSRQYRDQLDSQHPLGLLKIFQSRFMRQYLVQRSSQHLLELFKILNRFLRVIIVTSGSRNISKVGRLPKNFNRISRANSVTIGIRNISDACLTSKKFQSRFSRQYRK